MKMYDTNRVQLDLLWNMAKKRQTDGSLLRVAIIISAKYIDLRNSILSWKIIEGSMESEELNNNCPK